MSKNLSQFFFGTNPQMWLGVVEDRNDPLQLGRLKVRIHGYHTDDKTLIPTEDLPWGLPVLPVTSGGVSGVGANPQAMIGACVFGVFADFPDCQNPIIFGLLNQLEMTGAGAGSTPSSGGSPTTSGKLHQPGNQINDQSDAGGAGTIEPTGTGPKWLQIAQGELKKGVKEFPGAANNPEVLKYGKRFGFTTDGPSHPWCSAFATWCLEKSGASIQGLTGMARSHLTAPCHETLKEPILGCIAVYHRGSSSTSGHVGFWVGRQGGRDKLLGGNQSDAVTISTQSTHGLLGYRWPKGQPKPATS